MFTTTNRILLGGALLALAACAREPEPEPVTMAPTYNKMGEASCPAGTTLATDAETGAEVCMETMAM